MHMNELPMFTYNLWMGCLHPDTPCQLFCPVINIARATISNTLIIIIRSQIYIALISNKCSEALKSIDVILMCTMYNFSGNKARFSHTSTVTRLHSYPGKKIRVLLACILFLYRNQCF